MKQSLRLSSVLLLVLVLSLTLSACDDISLEEIWNSNANISTELETADGPEQSVPEDQTQSISENTESTPEETEPLKQQPDEMEASGLSKYLIIDILDYLDSFSSRIDMADTSFAIKLYNIKQFGSQPLHVKFDPENYYYACAYFDSSHDEFGNLYCCAQEYTWVRYERPEQITENYDGMTLICAFQINKSLFCHDIGPKDGLSDNMEHYLPYTPEFSEGVNIAGPVVFEKSFIYLNSSNLETVYYTSVRQYHDWVAFRCVELDGAFYVPFILYEVKSDGTRSENTLLEWEFDTYYADAMSVMIKDQYYESNSKRTIYYGLLAVEDVTRIIRQ